MSKRYHWKLEAIFSDSHKDYNNLHFSAVGMKDVYRGMTMTNKDFREAAYALICQLATIKNLKGFRFNKKGQLRMIKDKKRRKNVKKITIKIKS